MSIKKKVCHLTSAHPRYDARIFYKECVSLAEEGYEVYLFVNDAEPDEIKQGVHIVSTGYKAPNRIARILVGTKKIYQKAIAVNGEIYHLHDPELQLMARKLKRHQKTVVFDAHEDTEEQIKDKKWIPKPLLNIVSGVYRNYAKKVLKMVDAIITVTPQLVEKFGQCNPQTIMVTNYPIIKSLTDIDIDSNKSQVYVCFAGGIEEQWMHEVIINAIEQIDNIRYIIAGSASEEYLKRLRSLDGWKKVEFLGKIPYERVQEIYRGAIAGMAVNDCAQLRGKGTLGNTKLFECMEAGVPVVCTDYPLWKEVVEGNRCGICVNPQDPVAIANAIQYLHMNPEEARQMGENGRKAIREKYNWDTEKHKLLLLYQKLL